MVEVGVQWPLADGGVGRGTGGPTCGITTPIAFCMLPPVVRTALAAASRIAGGHRRGVAVAGPSAGPGVVALLGGPAALGGPSARTILTAAPAAAPSDATGGCLGVLLLSIAAGNPGSRGLSGGSTASVGAGVGRRCPAAAGVGRRGPAIADSAATAAVRAARSSLLVHAPRRTVQHGGQAGLLHDLAPVLWPHLPHAQELALLLPRGALERPLRLRLRCCRRRDVPAHVGRGGPKTIEGRGFACVRVLEIRAVA
mmetsp:Transcript_27746/g.80453  ORF Transcript_27746/g.80453 Transcript_27746/m.80453 type:complete len:255 (+) Transcript_27746:373-1137(+)